MKKPAVRGLTRLCAMLLTVGAVSFWPAACTDHTDSQTQIQSPQAIIDLLLQTVSLCDRNSFDTADAVFQLAHSALDRCSTFSSADSLTVNYLLCTYYDARFMTEAANLHSILAYELMLRCPGITDSMRSDILSYRSYVLQDEKLFDSAAVLAEEALHLELAIQPPRYRTIADRLIALSGIEYDRGNRTAAFDYFRRILGMTRLLPLDAEGIIASALMSTASSYSQRGEWAVAESLLVQTLKDFEEVHGSDHELSAIALTLMTEVLSYSGRQYESIGTARRAIAAFESLPEAQRTELHYTYHFLAGAYSAFGLYALSEECFRKEASLDSVAFGPDCADLCYPLMGLADLWRLQCRFGEAEPIYRQVLVRARQNWGPDTYHAAEVFVRLGLLFLATDRPREAEDMYQQARAVWNSHGLLTDARAMSIQTGLSMAAALQTHHDEAIARIRKALDHIRSQQAPSYFSVRSVLRTAAHVFGAAGQYDSSLYYYEQMVTTERTILERSFPYLTESQRLQWLNAVPHIHSGLIRLAMQVQQPQFLNAAFQMTINAKARAIEAGLAERHIALCSDEQQARPILEEYLRVSTRLAGLSYMQLTQPEQSIQADIFTRLAVQRDSLELSLSQVCFESGNPLKQPNISSTEVIGGLAPGAVLWDIVRFCPTEITSPIVPGGCPCDEHYAVFVCDADGVRTIEDVGRVVEIDSLVIALRAAVGVETECVYSPLAPLHEARIRSIAEELTARLPALPDYDSGSPGTLYVSPDGMLGLLPFELLARDNSRYLIDAYRIVYLASSRDLAGQESLTPTTRRAVIFAAPAYDSPGDPVNSAIDEPTFTADRKVMSEDLVDCFGSGFLPLPQTRVEADAVAALLASRDLPAAVRTGREATENLVRTLTDGPSIIHFATHGFFCDQAETAVLPSLSSPLLRSGLALAGANLTLRGAARPAEDDGILTAYEISAMDLSRTELVVLSACETGAGDITRSEGVLGLTRAFRRAGARSVIMNLWNAPDEVAGETMTEFYRFWTGGATKADALRGAALLAKQHAQQRYGHTHPYLWCGFVLIGDPQ